MSKNINIFDVSENDFEERVLKASNSNLILVDFWAPWCGPCKQLTPVLEKIINNAKGKVRLAKINIDENQQISTQLKIQSIPAVFAFKDSQPVSAFQGVIPESQIIEFIEKCLGEKLEDDFSEFYENILNKINAQEFQESKNILEDFLAENPTEYKSFALYIDCLGQLNQYTDADNFIESLSDEALSKDHVKSAIQKINIKKENSNGPSLEKIISQLKTSPNNIDLIVKLADKYFAENMIDEAFELLLSNFKKNKEKIKEKFLEFFQALGNDNQKTVIYRKKLSSILFS